MTEKAKKKTAAAKVEKLPENLEHPSPGGKVQSGQRKTSQTGRHRLRLRYRHQAPVRRKWKRVLQLHRMD